MSLSVKVSFQTKNQKCGMNSRREDYNDVETRRFSIAEEVAANYDYLRAKTVSIMPCLEKKAFRLYWKDDEDDLIAFSSDDELLEALSAVSDDGVFRIFAREIVDESHPQQAQCGRTSGVHLGFPPMHLLQAALGAYGPWIGGGCSREAPRCHRAARSETTTGTDSQPGESQHRPEANATSTSDIHGKPNTEIPSTSAATGNDGKSDQKIPNADEKSSGKTRSGPFRDFPMPGQRGTEYGTSGDFLMNVVSSFSNILNTIAMNNRSTDGECTTGTTERPQSESTYHPTGDCRATDNAVDDKTKHAQSNTTSREPPSTASLSDGLIQVVESLKEMGFNDEDGWLTRLVATHSGQIEKIIEVIHATA